MNALLDKIAHWYFSKDALPYWCIFIFDCIVVFCTGLFSYALQEGVVETSDNLGQVCLTLGAYLVFYILGFRLLHRVFIICFIRGFVFIYKKLGHI